MGSTGAKSGCITREYWFRPLLCTLIKLELYLAVRSIIARVPALWNTYHFSWFMMGLLSLGGNSAEWRTSFFMRLIQCGLDWWLSVLLWSNTHLEMRTDRLFQNTGTGALLWQKPRALESFGTAALVTLLRWRHLWTYALAEEVDIHQEALHSITHTFL